MDIYLFFPNTFASVARVILPQISWHLSLSSKLELLIANLFERTTGNEAHSFCQWLSCGFSQVRKPSRGQMLNRGLTNKKKKTLKLSSRSFTFHHFDIFYLINSSLQVKTNKAHCLIVVNSPLMLWSRSLFFFFTSELHFSSGQIKLFVDLKT